MPTNNRVTQAEIDALLDAAETQEVIFWDKELVVSYRLPCGFTISGRGACIDPANFDIEIGRKVARENAAHQLWQLEGYRKQLELHTCSGPHYPISLKLDGDQWCALIGEDLQEGIAGFGVTPIDALESLTTNIMDATGGLAFRLSSREGV